MKISLGQKALLVIFLILLVDQSLKFWIKLHLAPAPMHNEIPMIGNWFKIHFTENPGMAFGMKFGGSFGKMLLSIFRIAAVFGIGWYLVRLVKTKAPLGLILSFSLILAGAIGNILDCAFYGLIFDRGSVYSPVINDWVSYDGVAKLSAHGYAGFLRGSVVDMLYFPIIPMEWGWHYPTWMPFVGGESFEFFRPVFNIADSAISVGVFFILIFQKRFFKHQQE